MSAQPGWYFQPDGSQRYWDGQAWTEHVQPLPQPPAPPDGGGVGPFAGSPAPRKPPFYKNPAFIAVMAVVIVASAMTAFGNGGGQQTASPRGVPTTTVTVTEAPTPEPTTAVPTQPSTGETQAASEAAQPEPQKAEQPKPETQEAEQPEPETFKMPKLVGKNLQDAQDQLQAQGSYLMDQQDASGLGRFQMLDSNWKVCWQKPAAGKVVPIDSVVVLASVKLTEKCP